LSCHEMLDSLKASHNFDYHSISKLAPTLDKITLQATSEATLLHDLQHQLQYTMPLLY